MTNEEKEQLIRMSNEERIRQEQIAMNEQMTRMYAELGQLKEVLGNGCMFAGTIDDYLDDMCGVRVDDYPDKNCFTAPDGSCVSEKECMHSVKKIEKKAEDKENA